MFGRKPCFVNRRERNGRYDSGSVNAIRITDIPLQRKTQEILRVKFARLQKELEELGPDMQNNLREMDSCFDILIPQDISQDQSTEDQDQQPTQEKEER